ncbi:unnamed protein product [Bursaphelenchus xylophilus]|uniref:(pine wood nematode) hypothetical protein n=1 Tax=Bursaphelenchus xylophilus TaxID=6326 RepID=A0A1I7SW62_BURXY|nr:unnamed protein product [Bursaphelenchus xylophilus]CAG9098881.1 unnamed protein product [Bursaphelenchus xylophilus]
MPESVYDNLKPAFDPLSPLLQLYKNRNSINDAIPFHVTGVLENCETSGLLTFSLLQPRFNIVDLCEELKEHYGDAYDSGDLKSVGCSKLILGNNYLTRFTDGNFYRCRLIHFKNGFALVRFLDMDYEVKIHTDRIYELDFQFTTDKYNYSLVVPAYTLSPAALGSIGLPNVHSVKAGSIMDFLILHIGFRCLVLAAPHNFGLFRFSGQRLLYNSPIDEEWFNLLSEKVPEKRFEGQCYPSIKPKFGPHWNFGQVMGVDGLHSVFIRDLQSSIRAFYIHQRLQQLFNKVEFKSKFQAKEGDEFVLDQPCVFYDSTSKMYYRGKVTNLTDVFIDASGVDFPSRKIIGAALSSGVFYYLPCGFGFPSTVYPVKLVQQSTSYDQRYDELLQGLLFDNTPVCFQLSAFSRTVEMRLLDGASVLAEIKFDGDKGLGPFGASMTNRSFVKSSQFISSMPKWEAMGMGESGEKKSEPKRRTIASIFETSLPPRKPEKKGPPTGCDEAGYVFSDGYNYICYRTQENDNKFRTLQSALNTVRLTGMNALDYPTAGEYYLVRAPSDNCIYRATIEKVEEDMVTVFHIDTGMKFKQHINTFRGSAMPLSSASTEFSLEAVQPLAEGPFKMAGDIPEDEKILYKHLKLKVALRCVLSDMGTAYIKQGDKGIYLYNREGESINDYYVKTMRNNES